MVYIEFIHPTSPLRLNKLPNAAILRHTELDECIAAQSFILDRTNRWYGSIDGSTTGQFTV